MNRIIIRDGLNTCAGSPYTLGAAPNPEGCNFAIFSRNAVSVTLLLFNDYKDSKPSHTIEFDKKINKTGDIWHIFVYGIKDGQYYGYTVDGPYSPEKDGHRFNKNKLLLDPYAKAVSGSYHWNVAAAYGYDPSSPELDLSFSEKKNFDTVVKSIVVDGSGFEWNGDKPLNIPMNETIIYEMHVRGFTFDKNSGVKNPGTYLGIVEKIPYLKKLGITTIELLPVQEFNELENIRKNPLTGEKLKNFWGYSSLAFFAPDSWYSGNHNGFQAVSEFKEMVKALHSAGIEIIIDVVYNHTGEGNEYGPTLSFRGLDNSIYYMLENGKKYKNYSGCGNTLNCNHPVVKRLIMDSLRYWVIDMHVDGFRFDLAAILGRDESGNWVPSYSVLAEIALDPILSNTKIIAEGWDAAGLFKVGGFPPGWAEWNSHFRDDVRSFIKGDENKARAFSNLITGSPDLFRGEKRSPYHGINFITAHDGFTLNDLVSFNEKHNEANGENNKDGLNYNFSWNCGIEGSTKNKSILELRNRQMKNLFAVLMMSQGTPMILSGDEFKFSKKGNNNTYCQDNSLNWLDWKLLNENRDYFEFCRFFINFRKKHPSLRRKSFFNDKENINSKFPEISWHGTQPDKPDWNYSSHSAAFFLNGSGYKTGAGFDDCNIYAAINAYWDDLEFTLPSIEKINLWKLNADTSKNPGFYPEGKEVEITSKRICVKSRSLVVLTAE